MRIGTREIGPDRPPYIIAELGVNHDGSPERALELTRLAVNAGADAVKLQFFRAEMLMSRASRLAAYQAGAGERDPAEMLRRLELSPAALGAVVRLAHELGVHAIVTVFSVELVAEAERLEWDAYKTASPDIINRPLLKALDATGKPLIVSTGASTMAEVERAVGWLAPRGWEERWGAHREEIVQAGRRLRALRDAGAPGAERARVSEEVGRLRRVSPVWERLALMQCVSAYPTPPRLANLGGVHELHRRFGGPIGYSDHTQSVEMGVSAVACGACLLEKHFTHDRGAAGPDHAASLEPAQFRAYAEGARGMAEYLRTRDESVIAPRLRRFPGNMRWIMEEFYGPGKVVLPEEEDVRAVSRQSLVTTRALPAGRLIERADLTIKRPGTGLAPYLLEETVGRVMARAVERDVPLTAADLA